MARVYGLGRLALFWRVILPGALPSILVGLRFSLGIMWLTLIVAETISASSGIGYMTMNAREFLQTDIVVLGIIVYALLGKLADAITRRDRVAGAGLASGLPTCRHQGSRTMSEAATALRLREGAAFQEIDTTPVDANTLREAVPRQHEAVAGERTGRAARRVVQVVWRSGGCCLS